MEVAALGNDDKVVLKTVVVGRNLGNRVQTWPFCRLTGLSTARSRSTQTGDKVTVANPDPNMIARDVKAAPNKPPSL